MDEEIETIDKSVINNVVKNEDQMTRSCSAIITPGEASESDEDEEEDNQNDDHFVESEEFVSEKQTNDSMNQSSESRISEDSSVGDSIKYNTLLHKKLREKNEQLKRELAELACGPYNSATKEVGSITKQLIHSQKMVQNVSATLRKVSNELFSLEESIDNIRNNKNILINDFISKSNASKETETEVSPDSVSSSTSHQN